MSRELTGRKVLAITLAAFGVVIAVNVVMAVKAVRTFPGLEVANSYVASQTFDADRAAQQALGWTAETSVSGGVLTIALQDAQGNPAPARDVTALIGRPTESADDITPALAYEGGLWTAPVKLAPGKWMMHLSATAPNGTVFRQRLEIVHG